MNGFISVTKINYFVKSGKVLDSRREKQDEATAADSITPDKSLRCSSYRDSQSQSKQ